MTEMRNICAFLAMLIYSTSAIAEQISDTVTDASLIPIGQWHVAIALGFGVKSNPVIDGDDLPLIVLPSIKYYGEKFHLDNGDLGYSLIEQQKYSIGLVATLNEEFLNFSTSHPKNLFGTVEFSTGESVSFTSEQDSLNVISEAESQYGDFSPEQPAIGDDTASPSDGVDDSPIVDEEDKREYRISYADIHARHWSADAGIQAFWYFANQSKLRLRLLTDVSNRHHGHNIKLSYHLHHKLTPHWALNYHTGIDWLSENLVNYYYGISAKDNASTNQYYQAKSAIQPYLKINSIYRLNKHWQFVTTLKYQPLASAITRSPLVDEKYRSTIFVGVNYAF